MVNNSIFAQNKTFLPLSVKYVNRVADAIFIIEGGNNTKYFYGIKSINTNGNKSKARKICINTINNNWKRYNNLKEFLPIVIHIYTIEIKLIYN
jgi:hypothetical protein